MTLLHVAQCAQAFERFLAGFRDGRSEGRYRGQCQQWYVMRFLGRDSEIDIATDDPEFSAWRWAELELLPELIIPFKKKLFLC